MRLHYQPAARSCPPASYEELAVNVVYVAISCAAPLASSPLMPYTVPVLVPGPSHTTRYVKQNCKHIIALHDMEQIAPPESQSKT